MVKLDLTGKARVRNPAPLKAARRLAARKAFTIVGFDRDDNKFYYNGSGFGSEPDVVVTFRTQVDAEKKMHQIVNRLPARLKRIALANVK